MSCTTTSLHILYFFFRQSQSYLPSDKLAIRAAILQDVEELESLFSDLAKLPQVYTLFHFLSTVFKTRM